MSYCSLKTQEYYTIKWNDIGKHREVRESLTRFNYDMEWASVVKIGVNVKKKMFVKLLEYLRGKLLGGSSSYKGA